MSTDRKAVRPKSGGSAFTPTAAKRGGPLLFIAIPLLAFNLRAPITSVSPLLERVRGDLGLSGVTISVLASLPVLCLGVFAFMAPRLGERVRSRTLLAVLLGVLAAGALIRTGSSAPQLLLGTVLVAAPIGVANVLLPGLIKREFPDSVAGVSVFYSAMLTFGAAVGPALVVPLSDLTGSAWRAPLVLLTVPMAVAAIVAVLIAMDHRGADAGALPADAVPVPIAAPRLWRDPLAWRVTVFFGAQALLSYTAFGWLPTMWQDRGMSAASGGLALSLCNLVGMAGAALLSVSGRRFADQRPAAVTVACLSGLGLAGVLLAPRVLLWPSVILLGLGLGAGFALAISLFALRSPDAPTTAALSGMAQGIGYLIGVLGPLGAGVLHDMSGAWHWTLLALLLACAAQALTGLGAGRTGTVNRAPASEKAPSADGVTPV
ncbi:MFS transporter [Streptomyces sp. NPDC097640]|uniref:MFS transporter n=1 Tax=Streptomyces sp. NPDC097640 TaxID=3157229 RepID=UPI0033222622